MRRNVVVLAVLVGASMLATVAPASAETPGPNGRIYFIRDTAKCEGCHATTIDPDGTDPTHVPGAHEGRWSPDGKTIATYYFLPDGRLASVLIDVADASRTEFRIDDPTLNLACFVWTPDASRLICEGWDDVNPGHAAGMFSVDATDGSDPVRLTSNPSGGHDIPTDLSPDGSMIVFLRENPQRAHRPIAIFVANVDGSDPVQVGGWRNGSICCSVSWSPDGSAILFAAKGVLHTVAPDGSAHAEIAVDSGDGFAFIDDPSWSPDGTRIVFSMFLERSGNTDLYTAAADGTDLEQVTDTPRAFEAVADWGQAPTVDA